MTNPMLPVDPDPPVAPQTETKFVRMWNPDLEAEGEFPAESVGHHAIAGWQVIDEPPPAEAAAEPAHVSREDVDRAQGVTTQKSKAGNRRASQSTGEPPAGGEADTGSNDKE